MKLKFFIFFAATFFCAQSFLFAISSLYRDAALRFLQEAETCAKNEEWTKCQKAAFLGRACDENVSDLWYFLALALYKNGSAKKEVIPLLEHALYGANWMRYNKSAARIFFADLLYQTGRAQKALEVLDEVPALYSADSECVRAKCYYALGDAKNIFFAREKIDNCGLLFPQDARFARIFFTYEYALMRKKNFASSVFDYFPPEEKLQKTVNYFIFHIPKYLKNADDLEIYAAIFSEGEKKTQLLKQFFLRGGQSALFASEALQDGVLSEDEALEYFLNFMNKSNKEGDFCMSLFEVERFAHSLKSSVAKEKFSHFLRTYNGALFCDTNNTLENNLCIFYESGVPKKIVFDADNNDVADWVCNLESGVPKFAHFLEKKISIEYGTYPCPVKIVFEEVPGEENSFGDSFTIFTLPDGAVDAKIFRLCADPFILSAEIPYNFFIADEKSLWSGNRIFDMDALVSSVSCVEKPSRERDGATVRFSMLSGTPYFAEYFAQGKLYAHAKFGNPLLRSVDRDGDGIFETTEIYSKLDGAKISKEDLDFATQNIWGSPVPNSSIYLQSIQIDRNGDAKADFTEEYFSKDLRVSTWDFNFDGEWDCRHTIFPKDAKEPREETTEFFTTDLFGKRNLVLIKFLEGEPKEISFLENLFQVQKGNTEKIFWVGKKGSEEQEKKILNFMKDAVFGVVRQFDFESEYLQAIFVDGKIFVRLLKKADVAEPKAND